MFFLFASRTGFAVNVSKKTDREFYKIFLIKSTHPINYQITKCSFIWCIQLILACQLVSAIQGSCIKDCMQLPDHCIHNFRLLRSVFSVCGSVFSNLIIQKPEVFHVASLNVVIINVALKCYSNGCIAVAVSTDWLRGVCVIQHFHAL